MSQHTPGPWESGHTILAEASRNRLGFLREVEVLKIAADPLTRLELLLVRCGSCRFLAPAQDVAHLTRCIAAGGDYIRDVSVPAGAQGRP